ncbi:hypothetical protein JOF56_008376 [Kibdelosporangium banguiense]|uniref:Uncharacterized protein n=1 Tax=Kibdelosporangium banguiense TaxID=1365924 RepID=A0ABS4TU99_9PSEU|nr:hypothetical protein [Kibdelosporangium banguiense]MBP2327991.1 hypothetical protein [Kibdelosporangium banguiense]
MRKLFVIVAMILGLVTAIAGTAAAAPGDASSSATVTLEQTDSAQAPSAGIQLASCEGPYGSLTNFYFYCTVLTTTTFYAFCSDGKILYGVLPPGLYTVRGSCAPGILTGVSY